MGKDINLNSPEWRDIVFEGKNKKYGAYYLRSTSSKRHIVAFFVVLVFVAIIAALPAFLQAVTPKKDKLGGIDTEVVMADLSEPDVPEEPPVEIPPETPPPPPLKETVQFTPPVIKEVVSEEKEMKTVEELNEKKDVQISIKDVTGPDVTKDGKDIQDLKKEQRDMVGTGPIQEKPFTSVEQMPQYPGGDAELMKYIATNLKYPVIAQENGVQGQVVIRFVVTKDGDISDVQVLRSLDPSCDKEAVRVVKSMKKWIPGKQNGRAVAVYFTLPVRFKLQN